MRDREGSETHKLSSSSFGRNSFKRTTLSAFLPLRSMLRSPAQSGSNGSTSVMCWTRRSCETANEHSVRNVALLVCECERVKVREPACERADTGEQEAVDDADEVRRSVREKRVPNGVSSGPAWARARVSKSRHEQLAQRSMD